MKHADATTFARLDDVLIALRAMPDLREPRPGAFSRAGRAFVHFHDDPTGLFADVRLDADGPFLRLPVTSRAQRRDFLARVRSALDSGRPTTGVAARTRRARPR
jgi:hypothetical protein